VFSFVTESVIEGAAQVVVPKLEALKRAVGDYAPSRAPVFYNPLMELNRDVAVLVLQAYQKMADHRLVTADPLAGCGVRGVRFAKEAEGISEVHMNDINPEAFKMMHHNIKLNALTDRVFASNEDANLFLSRHAGPNMRFDFIDMDPSGTPVPYLDSAIRASRDGGMLALTATDLAPLCGVYATVALRKYGGFSLRTEYCRELAVRLLSGCLATVAAKHEIGVDIVFSHSSDHYVRVYALVRHGARLADASIERLGHVFHCFACFHRETVTKIAPEINGRCSECGSPLKVAGPLWLGRLVDRQFCGLVEADAVAGRFRHGNRVAKLVSLVKAESDAPVTYYVVDAICDKLNVPIPPLKKVMDRLREKGFQAVATHFHSRGIKTNAPAKEVTGEIIGASR